jgi:Alginate lyase
MVGQKVGVDLWHYTTPEGGSLFRSVNFLVPAATGAEAWGYPDLDFQAFAATDVVEAAADAGDRTAATVLPDLAPPPGGECWQLRPAPEQLDPISS